MKTRPNVLLVVIDCLRSDRVFGPGRTCRTPQIDALEARSAKFPRLFVENPITAPSFASIFTGCYSLAHGVTSMLGVQMDPSRLTLAEMFAGEGYHTRAEVTGPLLPMLGAGRGFAEYNYREQTEYCFSPWGRKLLRRLAGGELPEPWFLLVHLWEIHEPRQVQAGFEGDEWGGTGYDRALSALDGFVGELVRAAGEEALVVLTGDHGERVGESILPGTLLPYFMDKLQVKMLDRAEDARVHEDVDLMLRRGPELQEILRRLEHHTRDDEGIIPPLERLKLGLKLIKVGNSRLVTQRLRPSLRGLRDFFSLRRDDLRVGWAVGSGRSREVQLHMLRASLAQFHLQHGYHFYDYLTRVPFLVAGPAVRAGDRPQESCVRHIDILPTLGELLEFDLPSENWHGRSFAPLLTEDRRDDRPIYMEARGGIEAIREFYLRGLRSGGWKVAYAVCDATAPLELYDLAADPEEKNNLAAVRPDLAARLREEAEDIARLSSISPEKEPLSAKDQMEMIKKLKALGYL